MAGREDVASRACRRGRDRRSAPVDRTSWRVDFAQLEGGTYVTRETALTPIDYGKAGTLRDVVITFAELRPTNRLTPEESLGLSGSVGTADP